MPNIQKEFILESIFILTHNIFNFNEQIYLQMDGTAMGTKSAPSFANLYMGAYEDIYIMGQHAWRDCIVKYKCYIDDSLCGEEQKMTFKVSQTIQIQMTGDWHCQERLVPQVRTISIGTNQI